MSSSKKSKSSGLRILWIPGGRKSHPKGRYSSTNKTINYSPAQKKSQVWSLGGSKAQKELLDLPTTEAAMAATTSSLAVLGGAAIVANNLTPNSIDGDGKALSECATLPATPTATSSPAAATSTSPPPLIVTAEILDFHNHFGPDELKKVPLVSETDLSTSAAVLNSSGGTTASLADAKTEGEAQASPHKGRYRNHNNNHEDINSIESISSCHRNQVSDDFDWIDEMVQQRDCKELMHKNKRKKSKKTLANPATSESDQLDGKKYENYDYKDNKTEASKEESDEKVVKCLYYSLMCCDCTIS